MPSTKLLKGVPYNLLQSYLSTLSYYSCGYMADWIYCGAIHFNIERITIDIFDRHIEPMEMNIKPLLYYLDKMNLIISNSLIHTGFQEDYIIKAKMDFRIKDLNEKSLFCNAMIEDKNGKIYNSKEIIEYSYDPFDFVLKYNEIDS